MMQSRQDMQKHKEQKENTHDRVNKALLWFAVYDMLACALQNKLKTMAIFAVGNKKIVIRIHFFDGQFLVFMFGQSFTNHN